MSKKKIDPLKGFEDVLDLVGKNKDFNTPKRPKDTEDHKTFDYLEKESIRLDKLDQFHSIKLKTQKNYPQLHGLIIEQKRKRDSTKENLKEVIIKNDSHFTKFLEELYRSLFIKDKP